MTMNPGEEIYGYMAQAMTTQQYAEYQRWMQKRIAGSLVGYDPSYEQSVIQKVQEQTIRIIRKRKLLLTIKTK